MIGFIKCIIIKYIIIFTVKPFIIGDGLQGMIIKKGQVISYDIKYGGEPEPEVTWMKGEEVKLYFYILFFHKQTFILFIIFNIFYQITFAIETSLLRRIVLIAFPSS